jgi:hypothetical protein
MNNKSLNPNMTLKEAVYETVHHSEKPLKLIAEEIGMGISHLTRAALPEENGTGCNLPSEKITPIIRSTNKYTILDVLEQSVGRVGIKLPDYDKVPKADICQLTMKSMVEYGELIKEIEKAIAENKIKPDEQKRIMKEGYDAVQAILTLMFACKGKFEP